MHQHAGKHAVTWCAYVPRATRRQLSVKRGQYRSTVAQQKKTYLGVELLDSCCAPEQRLRECAELILLDLDNRDEACPGEIERVLVQAVQVALLDVAGGTWWGVWRVRGGSMVRW